MWVWVDGEEGRKEGFCCAEAVTVSMFFSSEPHRIEKNKLHPT